MKRKVFMWCVLLIVGSITISTGLTTRWISSKSSVDVEVHKRGIPSDSIPKRIRKDGWDYVQRVKVKLTYSQGNWPNVNYRTDTLSIDTLGEKED